MHPSDCKNGKKDLLMNQEVQGTEQKVKKLGFLNKGFGGWQRLEVLNETFFRFHRSHISTWSR
jgi:hypothetical protein